MWCVLYVRLKNAHNIYMSLCLDVLILWWDKNPTQKRPRKKVRQDRGLIENCNLKNVMCGARCCRHADFKFVCTIYNNKYKNKYSEIYVCDVAIVWCTYPTSSVTKWGHFNLHTKIRHHNIRDRAAHSYISLL